MTYSMDERLRVFFSLVLVGVCSLYWNAYLNLLVAPSECNCLVCC